MVLCYALVESCQYTGHQIVKRHGAIFRTSARVDILIAWPKASMLSAQLRHWLNGDTAPTVQVQEIGIANAERMVGADVDVKAGASVEIVEYEPVLCVLGKCPADQPSAKSAPVAAVLDHWIDR